MSNINYIGHYGPRRWKHEADSKRQEPITQWRTVVSKKNGISDITDP